MKLKPLDNSWPERIDYAKQTIEVPSTKKARGTHALTLTLSGRERPLTHCEQLRTLVVRFDVSEVRFCVLIRHEHLAFLE